MSATVNIRRTTPSDADLRYLVALLDAELRASNGDVQDILDQFNLIGESFKVIIAYSGSAPIACGCFKDFEAGAVEIKRMFVHKDHRRSGLATTVLGELESWARELGYERAVLETGTRLTGAVNLYKTNGYKVRPQYGQYVDMDYSVCMEKSLSQAETAV